MDERRWARVKDIFSGVVDLDPGMRLGKLDEICGGDRELKAEVEALLRSNDEIDDFIERPAFTVADAFPIDHEPAPNKTIGRYRIVREIGRGGMGAVFLATRDDGEFEQQVAIKVVSSAFLGRESLRRFRQERQILARLNHPNIARLLDGGVTDDGLPFLVMEYVAGATLTDRCDLNDMSIDERLRLFLKICGAFAYAHGNLIVHRDIKPSNILVTSDGQPKLLDFGLAKIMDIENDDVRTATNFRALTPAYASPEQLRGEALTTASDIYSLGVVLYELLTATRPFNHESVPLEKLIQFISVTEPEKPSSKVEINSSDGATTKISAKNRHALKGDLDNIVLMAMRKDPERRYRSVEQFADDIERHLDGRPIAAAEDTFAYRSSKFVKRHWIGVASAAAIVILLLVGIAATSWEARAARRAQARSETIGAFMQSVLGSAAPTEKGADVKVKDVMADAATRAQIEFADDPEAMSQVLVTLGCTYLGLAEESRAEEILRTAAQTSEKASGDQNPTTGAALAWLGVTLGYQSKYAEGEPISRRAVDIERKISPEGSVDLGYALFGLASNLIQKGDAQGAYDAAQEASGLIKQYMGERHGYYIATRNQVAWADEMLGRSDDAKAIFRDTLAQADLIDPRYRIFIAQASAFYGRLLIKGGEFEEARPILTRGEMLYQDILGDSNTSVAAMKQMLGKVDVHQGRPEQAVTEFRESLDMFLLSLPPENSLVIESKIGLGLALTRTGKIAEGERYVREAQTNVSLFAPENPQRAEIDSTLAECLTIRRQFADAETLLLKAYAAEDAARDKGQAFVDTKKRLSTLYRLVNRPSDAIKYQ